MNDTRTTKYAIVLPDGAADEPVDVLDGKTPMEVANTPNMDWIASHGRQGSVVTVPDGFSPGSDVATLTLFGYDPHRDHTGRAPIEAVARGIKMTASEVVFRCNFVTIIDGCMADFTAGHISQSEADKLINGMSDLLTDEQVRFCSGVSYRNLMISEVAGDGEIDTTPPHDIPDESIDDHRPRGVGADRIERIMQRARDFLMEHEINDVRRDLGDNPATDIWLWGQGRPTVLEPFATRFGLRGAVIAAVDVIRGIAIGADMDVIAVSGATGYLDTDYRAKGQAAVEALDQFDLIAVHIEAPDEAGHLGDVDAKVSAIEQVDEHIVGPLLERLRAFDAWKILVAPDHPTPVSRRVHTSEPPPFCIASHLSRTATSQPFSEAAARRTGLHIDPGHELMEYFLKG